MSGPDILAPLPGSNAVGSFAIGISQIGSIPPFNIWDTIISQYANSAVLTQLISNFADYLDPTTAFDAFFDDIWNIDTARGYGLDVWGRIVGVTRTLQIPNVARNLGFEEATNANADPFGQSAFYAGAPFTSNYLLSDDAFRVLLFAKALSNISDGSIPSINQLLLNLFPHRGNCFVRDGENMSMTYVFRFALTPVELAIVQTSGVLPKPAGVLATVLVSSANPFTLDQSTLGGSDVL